MASKWEYATWKQKNETTALVISQKIRYTEYHTEFKMLKYK